MNNVLFLFLRRMRFPLVLLLVVFAITVAGLALVPGVDAAGNETPGMGLFMAFYVITYTSTTIGFGELPVPYSTAQRLWMTFSMYLSVLGWSYSVLSVISLIQDSEFRSATRASLFARRMRRLTEPFYIVCGFGDTGARVCHGLDRLGLRFVVVDSDPQRVARLHLEEFHSEPPTLVADASVPTTLMSAGLMSPWCRGVLALSASDDTNRAIAVTARLLAPDVPMLARVGEVTADLTRGPFAGEFIVNPFDRFAQHLVEAVAAPEAFHLREILNGLPGDPLPARHHPPRGHWIMCGYGRFGHRVRERLELAGQRVTVIDRLHFGEPGVDIKGSGTDPETLIEAGIEEAVGLVAGNKDDLKNLAIAIVARDLKPDVFIVTRQNQTSNAPLFDAFPDDLVMEPSRIVAHEFLAVITTPLLARFTGLVDHHPEPWCARVSEELAQLNGPLVPETWSFTLSESEAPAVHASLASGHWVTVRHLVACPYERDTTLDARVILVSRDGDLVPLPESGYRLAAGDEVLVAGSAEAARLMRQTLQISDVLDYVRSGHEHSGSWLWAALRRRRVPDRVGSPHRDVMLQGYEPRER